MKVKKAIVDSLKLHLLVYSLYLLRLSGVSGCTESNASTVRA
jgi:hypothetical protein